jgi:hypothetical protein
LSSMVKGGTSEWLSRVSAVTRISISPVGIFVLTASRLMTAPCI